VDSNRNHAEPHARQHADLGSNLLA
jgi:hypothetical protein